MRTPSYPGVAAVSLVFTGKEVPLTTIRASMWNIISQVVSPFILVFIGVALKVGRPGWLFPLMWITAGVGLGVASFLFLPISARFDEQGITRVFVLRRDHLDWDQIASVERTKTGFTFRRSTPQVAQGDAAPVDKHRRWGGAGLAVTTKTGQEKAITESLETQDQHDEIRDLVRRHAPEATWRVTAPSALLTRS